MGLHKVKIELEPDQPETDDNRFPHTVEADDEKSAIEEARKTYPTGRITYVERIRS